MKKVCFLLSIFLLQCAYGKSVPVIGECPTPQSFRMARFNEVFFQFKGEYLYWKANVDGLPYAMTYLDERLNVPGPTFRINHNYEEKFVRLKKDSGFRITGGINIPPIEWDSSFSWTHFATKGNDRVDEEIFAPAASFGVDSYEVVKIWEAVFYRNSTPGTELVDYLSANQEFKYNTADWEMGRSFKFHDWVFFRPFFGLRGAWIKQKLQIFSAEPDDPDNSIVTSDMSLINNFRGVGPRFGIGGKMSIFEILGVYANASTSVLYGNFKLKEIEAFTTDNQGNFFPFRRVVDSSRKMVKSTFQLNTGLEVGYTFNGNVKIEANIEYEFNYWPNQIQLFRFLAFQGQEKRGGDVMLQGILVGGSIYY